MEIYILIHIKQEYPDLTKIIELNLTTSLTDLLALRAG